MFTFSRPNFKNCTYSESSQNCHSMVAHCLVIQTERLLGSSDKCWIVIDPGHNFSQKIFEQGPPLKWSLVYRQFLKYLATYHLRDFCMSFLSFFDPITQPYRGCESYYTTRKLSYNSKQYI